MSEMFQRAMGAGRRHAPALLQVGAVGTVISAACWLLSVYVLALLPLGIGGLLGSVLMLAIGSGLLIVLAGVVLATDARPDTDDDDLPGALVALLAFTRTAVRPLAAAGADPVRLQTLLRPHLLALAVVMLGGPMIMFTGSSGPLTALLVSGSAAMYSLCVMTALTSRDEWGLGTAIEVLQARSPESWVALAVGTLASAVPSLALASVPAGSIVGWCIGAVVATCCNLAVLELAASTDLGRTPVRRRAADGVTAATDEAPAPQAATDAPGHAGAAADAARSSTPDSVRTPDAASAPGAAPAPEMVDLVATPEVPAGHWVQCRGAGTVTLAVQWLDDQPLHVQAATGDGAWYTVPPLAQPGQVQLPVAEGWLWVQATCPTTLPERAVRVWWSWEAGTAAAAA
jgi:hypothetical protein